MQRIVFGLKDVYNAQCENAGIGLTSSALELNIPGLRYGFVLGGEGPGGNVSKISRLDFATETVAEPGNLPGAKYGHQGVYNENYGYAGGGTEPGPTRSCSIIRLDFSNETTSAPGNNQTIARAGTGAINSANFGYFAGGFSPPHVSSTDKLDFSTESTSSLGQNLHAAKIVAHNNVGSSSYGYFGGGYGGGTYYCQINRLDFSVETVALNSGSLSQGREVAGAVRSGDYGYFGGGYAPPGNKTLIDRLDFSTDTVSQPGNNLPVTRRGSGCVNSLDFGYFVASPGNCTIDRIDFDTETISSPGNPLTYAVSSSTGVSVNRPQVFRHVPGNSEWKESPNHGYFCGGYTSVPINTMDRIDFASETTSAPGNNLIQAGNAAGGIQNTNYAYLGGGQGNGNWSTISRLEFQTETVANPPAKQTFTAGSSAGISARGKGYFAGNASGSPDSCTVDRLDFTTETVTANTPIGQSKREPIGTQTDDFGYCVGGRSNQLGIDWSTINRVDFATDIFSTIPSALPQGRRNKAAVQNTKNAYFCLGGNAVCTVERMEFSTETVSAINGFGPPRWSPGGVSSFSYGFIAGGLDPGIPANVSTINRLDFDTETSSTPSSKLNLAKRLMPGVSGGVSTRRVGKATYGYVAGGIDFPPGGETSTIERFEFLTETVTNPSVIGKLSRGNQELASFSSSEYGYFGGGYTPGTGTICQIDRLDFSNDTVSGNSSSFQTTRYQSTGIQNSNYGYAGGGNAPSISCTIARLDFSTETVAQPNNYSMTLASRVQGSISSPNYGYFAGGLAPTRTCSIDRFDFTTETGDNPAFSLPTAVRGPSGTQNTNDGYFAGGDTPTAISNIFRLDFTTETLTTNPNNLSQARTLSAKSSSGDGRYGYFYGGYISSTIDRIEFDSGTVSTPSQKLTIAKYSTGSVANG